MKRTDATLYALALAIMAITGLAVASSWAQDVIPRDPRPAAGYTAYPGAGDGPRPGAAADLLLPPPGGNRYFYYDSASADAPGEDLSGLLQQYQGAEGDESRSALKTKLTEALGRQFDARQKRHEQQLAELEAQVKKLRDLVTKRQANRAEIISLRLEQMLRETQGLGW